MTSLGPSVLGSAADRRWPVDQWRYQRRLRIGLLVGWVLVMGAAAAFGARSGNLQQLRADVASGQVRTVVVGEEPPLGGPQHVSWHRGWFRYELPVDSPGIAEDLQRANPGLRVLHTDERPDSQADILGWHLHGWGAFTVALLLLGTFASLITGPPPWPATRWAWFWFMALPIGIPAFLLACVPLLMRPTPQPPPLRKPRRPLTGGWALLLTVALGSAWNW